MMLYVNCIIWRTLQQRQRRKSAWRLIPRSLSCTSWCCSTQCWVGRSGRANITGMTMISRARHVSYTLHPAQATMRAVVVLPQEHTTKHALDDQDLICHALLRQCLSVWQKS